MTSYKYDKRHLPYGHSAAIRDPEVLEFLKNLQFNLNSVLDTPVDNFCINYIEWIKSYKSSKILGLSNFPFFAYSNGTTESFDKFYQNNQRKRFRCFKGEYLYHELAWRNNNNWLYVEDDSLEIGDALIVSFPFADTGNEHGFYKTVLKECEEKQINVLVDCAYFAISKNIEVDLNYNCITDVVFSLSKIFPVAHARIGIRLSKKDSDDTLFVYQKSKYNNRVGAFIGQQLISNFSPDFIVNNYRSTQISLCNELAVIPSQTVLFGLGDSTWNDYNRGTEINRLSFHNYLHENKTN